MEIPAPVAKDTVMIDVCGSCGAFERRYRHLKSLGVGEGGGGGRWGGGD